MANITVH